MKIRMRTTYAGPHGNCDPGGVIDLDDTEGKRLIAAGFAEPANVPHISAKIEAAATRTKKPNA